MDGFMDKLAQRINAQEMIKANSEAETAEFARLRKQLEEYENCLKEMKEISLANTESSEKIQELLSQLDESKDALVKKIETMNADAYEVVHKENVKVYRNVQAVIQEESASVKNAVQVTKKSVNGKFVVGLVFAILAFVAATADLTFDLLLYFHII